MIPNSILVKIFLHFKLPLSLTLLNENPNSCIKGMSIFVFKNTIILNGVLGFEI